MNQQHRKALRLRVMRAIYDAASGSEYNFVDGWQLLGELGVEDQDMADACKYLEGEYLIKIHHTLGGRLTPHHVQITHYGIKEIEQSLEDPESSTEHFPPLVSVEQHFHGDVIGSSIATGSSNVHQTT